MMTRRLRDHFRGVPRLAVQMRRLARLAGADPGLAPQPLSALLQAPIARHRADVLDLFALQKQEQLGAGKAPVQADPERGRREGGPELAQQGPQDAPGSQAGRRFARAQYRGHCKLGRLVVERHGGHHRQVAPHIVVTVEECELLLAVSGVVGGIQVDRDPGGAPVQTSPLLRDHGVGQRVRHSAQLARAHGVLEARQRRLRGQAEAP